MKFKVLMKKLWRKVRGGNPDVYELRLRGVSIGENCHIYGSIDDGHEFLVTIGDNVTLASGSKLLTHDGSTKKYLVIVELAELILEMMFLSVHQA